MNHFANLYEEFKRLEGQPVRILMNDKNVFVGIVLSACEYACRIINRCGDTVLVEYLHIDAVEEPKMRLKKCYCRDDQCWYDNDGEGFEDGKDGDKGNYGGRYC